jgi:hypothetical protein
LARPFGTKRGRRGEVQTLYVDPAVLQKFKDLARERGKSPGDFMAEIVKLFGKQAGR